MFGSKLGDAADELIKSRLDESDGRLCDEWLGQIELEGALLNSTLFGALADIPALAKGTEWNTWSAEEKEQYLRIIEPIKEALSLPLRLHYIPQIDCWTISSGTREHSLSRKMIGWRNNEWIYGLEVFKKGNERLTIEIYERSRVVVGPKHHESRLAFCLIHSKGMGVENTKDGSFLIAEYPLPDQLVLNKKGEYVAKSPKSFQDRLDDLGWKDGKDGFHDSYTDYFGDLQRIDRPGTYENGGIKVQSLIR